MAKSTALPREVRPCHCYNSDLSSVKGSKRPLLTAELRTYQGSVRKDRILRFLETAVNW
jgi:hypothetical protein